MEQPVKLVIVSGITFKRQLGKCTVRCTRGCGPQPLVQRPSLLAYNAISEPSMEKGSLKLLLVIPLKISTWRSLSDVADAFVNFHLFTCTVEDLHNGC